ncbi:MAG: DUF4215 domain-containing protein [Myxococcota bacterium]|nr:DUF4215 domain-containing protein [Myxococcota bacterium]
MLWAAIGTMWSCGSEVSKTSTASLSVEPEQIVFSKVAPGENELTVPLIISNTGSGRLLISSIALEETDDEKELSLVDADDLRNLTELLAGEEKVVQVKWRVIDALPDEGRITIEHNSGPPVIVPIETPDLDPAIDLSSDPEGTQPDMDRPDLEVTLVKARLGDIDSAVISIRSAARAPLIIDEICLQKPSGGCQDDPTIQFDAPGRFKLCGGVTRDINECPVAAVTDPIQFEDTAKFTVFFRPNGPDDKGNSAKITIRSNATEHKVTTVKVTGVVCDPEECPIPEPAYSLTSEPAGVLNEQEDLAVTLSQAIVGGIDQAVVTITSIARDPLTIDRVCMALDGDECGADDRQQLDGSGRFKLCDVDATGFDGCEPPQMPDMLAYGETAQFRVFYRPILAADTGSNAVIHVLSNANGRPMGRVTVTGVTCDGGNCGMESPTCGNGTTDEGEECDDGNPVAGDGCAPDCTIEQPAETCGNGTQDPGETCDDGNQIDGDGCSATCQSETLMVMCGNGILEFGETCDDGNQVDGDGCSATCETEMAMPVCGNNIQEIGEACDDGNRQNGDGCDGACQLEANLADCGNGIEEPGETCDDGNQITESCGYQERSCDVCNDRCQLVPGQTSFCGDGRVDAVFGEACDDGNQNQNDSCDNACRRVMMQMNICGNGIREGDEECDDGSDSYCNALTCRCLAPQPGMGQYGDGCNRGSDCASGMCVPGSLRDLNNQPVVSAGYCTRICSPANPCDGVDKCNPVRVEPGGCPTPFSQFVQNDLLNVCLLNETGLPCQNPGDCVPGATCIEPPNATPFRVSAQPYCAARCAGNQECPAGFNCLPTQIDNAIQTVCTTELISMSPCANGLDGQFPAISCGGVCPGNLNPQEEFNVALCLAFSLDEPGLCSCGCSNATQCPAGFACAPMDAPTGIPGRPKACVPIAGFTCPRGPGQCHSERCLPPSGRTPSQCIAACENNFDCPTGFTCRQVAGYPGLNCVPQ